MILVQRDKGLLPTEDKIPKVDVKAWLQKNGLLQDGDDTSSSSTAIPEPSVDASADLPECLRGVVDLPLSLYPPFMRSSRTCSRPPPEWGE